MVGRHSMDNLAKRFRMNYYQQKMGVSDLVLKIQRHLCWLTFQMLWNAIFCTEWIETLRYDAIGWISSFLSIGLCIARREMVHFQPRFLLAVYITSMQPQSILMEHDATFSDIIQVVSIEIDKKPSN
eukprot:732293_1